MSDILVLCYHAVSPDWPAPLSVTPEHLDAQLDLLVRRGYRGATFSSAVSGDVEHDRVVVLTFDDGYRSVLSEAQPILRAHGLPGTLFVATDWVGTERPMTWTGIDRWRGGPHEPELCPVGWDDLQTLVADGWEIGSHTCSHRRLTEVDDVALGHELSASRERVRVGLGTDCSSVAYPYGAADERVADAAARAGYSAGAVLDRWLVGHGKLRWPRVGIYHGDDQWRFRLKASPLVRRLRAMPRRRAA